MGGDVVAADAVVAVANVDAANAVVVTSFGGYIVATDAVAVAIAVFADVDVANAVVVPTFGGFIVVAAGVVDSCCAAFDRAAIASPDVYRNRVYPC